MLMRLRLLGITFITLLAFVTVHAHTEKNSIPCFSVGELGSKWTFTSDHLPTAVTVNGVHIVSWNILDPGCMRWILDNTQGLKDSALVTQHCPVKEGEALTVREVRVLDQLDAMIHHPTHPQSILALQEVGTATYAELQKRLPGYMKIVRSCKGPLVHEDILIYDNRQFACEEEIARRYKGQGNTWLLVKLRDHKTKQCYQIMSSHVPGGPANDPYMRELAVATLGHFDANAYNLVLGDQNRSPDYFLRHLNAVAHQEKMRQPFEEVVVPYPTHVNTLREASWIDNIFLAVPGYALGGPSVADGEEVLFDDVKNATQLMWKHFAMQEKIAESRETLEALCAQHQGTLRLFDQLVSEWRYYHLTTEGRFDLSKLLDAVVFAARAHEGQCRKDAAHTPYILHPMTVCQNVWREGQIRQVSVLVSALLHDTVEDTAVGNEEIAARFGKRVAQTVADVTNPPQMSTDESKQYQVDHAPQMILDAQVVKLADRLANIRDLLAETPQGWSEAKCAGYFEWGRKLLAALRGANVGLERALETAIAKAN